MKTKIKCQKCNELTKNPRVYLGRWLCFKCYSEAVSQVWNYKLKNINKIEENKLNLKYIIKKIFK